MPCGKANKQALWIQLLPNENLPLSKCQPRQPCFTGSWCCSFRIIKLVFKLFYKPMWLNHFPQTVETLHPLVFNSGKIQRLAGLFARLKTNVVLHACASDCLKKGSTRLRSHVIVISRKNHFSFNEQVWWSHGYLVWLGGISKDCWVELLTPSTSPLTTLNRAEGSDKD